MKCTRGDPRYFSGVSFSEFVDSLDRLNRRGIPFIVSYDGRRGDKVYGQDLPKSLEVYKLEVEAGRSTQSTLLGGDDLTYESVYLSHGLVNEMGHSPEEVIFAIAKPQKQLFDIAVD